MTTRPATLLVVDDSVSVRRLVVERLAREGFRVLEAENGLIGYERALAERPDLAISDVEMPVLDGWGFIAKVRSNESLDTMPVLMLTTVADRSSVRRAMDSGADDYLTKPWQGDELVDAVQGLLAKTTRHRADTERSMAELRSAVLGTVPHELRTPLTSVLVLSQLLLHRRGHYNEEQVFEAVGRIHRSAEKLGRTIGRMVDWAELNAVGAPKPDGRSRLSIERAVQGHLADPRFGQELIAMLPATGEGVEGAVPGAAPGAAPGHSASNAIGGHRIQCRLEPADLACDPTDLRRALVEVLGNALRFSRPRLPVRLTGTCVDAQRYALDVANMGEPVPPEFVRRIGALAQVDRARQEQQGVGLGLAIAQLALQRHGGGLEFTRLDGHPTTVRLWLRRSDSAAATAVAAVTAADPAVGPAG